ncbi:Crp/Fnr family transcriptional regulator [Actinomadura atramentaria]|uniref:Crp/Fnr family transcriptional regulator n=1 Tax=Actinomadura atramentaria TaxID=1990 RepID=UPI0003813F7F|nr:Crp/Fnr family transcriptional regulator [Actinomadura atramentaria]
MVLSAETWRRLTADAPARRFAANDVLMAQGSEPGFVLFLEAGRVKVAQHSPGGDVVVLAVRGPGEIIGDLSALGGGARSATVTAIDACATRALTAERFRARVTALGLHGELLRGTIERFREDERWRAEAAALPARPKVARALLRLALPNPDGGLDVGLDQAELGRTVGLSRGVVAAQLRALRAAGVVATGHRRIVVHDLDRLRALAASGQGDV